MALDFLSTPEGVGDELRVEEAPAEAPAAEGPARGPDGKFAVASEAPAAEAPASAPAAEPVAQAEPARPPEGYVPVSALMALRQEIRSLKEAPAAPPPPPDRYEDPAAYEDWRDQEFEKRLLNERYNTSERFAVQKHGAETIEKVKQWTGDRMQQDPLFAAKVQGHADPYEFAVQDWKREQLFSSLSDPSELDQFRAWKAAQQQIANPIPAATPQAPQPPTRSIASATSAGGGPSAAPVGSEAVFKSMFQ